MTPDQGHQMPVWPVIAASGWGYVVLLMAWRMAEECCLSSNLQLAVPFTVALLGLCTDSRR